MTNEQQFEKDFKAGLIEVYSPNGLNDKFENWDSLKSTGAMHGSTPLKAADCMMFMYALNYDDKDHYPDAKIRCKNWRDYSQKFKKLKKNGQYTL